MKNAKITDNWLLDKLDDPYWIIDRNQNLVYQNEKCKSNCRQFIGYELEIDQPILSERLERNLVEKWTQYYHRALQGESFSTKETFRDTRQNITSDFTIKFNAILNEEGLPEYVVCSSRKETLPHRALTEEMIFLNTSLDVFCIFNKEGEFVYISPASKAHWGYEPRELFNLHYSAYLHQEDVQKTQDILFSIFEGHEVKTFVNRYIKKEGGIAYNLWSTKWDKDHQCVFCVARDIQEKIEQDEIIYQSEERFKALVQEGSDLISILDIHGKYLYVSPTSLPILQLSPEELVGKSPFEFIHPDDLERTSKSLEKLLTTEKVIVEPFRFKNKNNQWRWLETTLTNRLDHPAIKGIVANSRDVTDKIDAQIKQNADDLFNQTILESKTDCIKILDRKGRLIYINRNGLNLMELDHFDAIKGKEYWNLWDKPNVPRIKEAFENALKGENTEFVLFGPTAKGTTKWWEMSISPVLIPGQPIQKIISVARDITKKKEEEHRLKLFESIIQHTKDSVVVTEAEPVEEPGPRIVYVNDAFTQLTGYTLADVVGKTPRILQGVNSDYQEIAKLSKALRKWQPSEITTINYKKNGEEFWVNFVVSPVADEKGWYTHWVSIQRDITEKKQNELKAEILGKISLNFSFENDLSESIFKVCDTINQFGGFDFTEIWLPTLENNRLHLFANKANSTAAETFYELSSETKFVEYGKGLTGKVWKEKSSILWKDIQHQEDFLRNDSAQKTGIQTILGIPLVYQDQFIGVLVIATSKEKSYLAKFVDLFKELESYIGSEINRKKLENDLKHLYNTLPDILGWFDLKGRILKINKSGSDLLGYSKAELFQKNILDFVHPNDKNEFLRTIKRIALNEQLKNIDFRLINKEERVIWLSWTFSRNIEEEVIYTIARDVTEEKKLRELNSLAGKLAKIGSWEVDILKSTVFWSDEIHDIHETDSKTFQPRFGLGISFFREDYQPTVKLEVGNCIREGTPFDFEAVIVTFKKRERWVRVIGNAEFIDGQCSRIYGSFQDIQSNKESELRLKSISDNLPGVAFQYVIDPDGTDYLKGVSRASIDIWNLTPVQCELDNELIWNQIKAGGDFDLVQKSIQESIQQNQNWNFQWRNALPSGEIRWHEGYGTPNILTDGTVIFNSLIFDITEKRKLTDLYNDASKLARIGSWELVLKNQYDIESLYWSHMLKEIIEVEPSYDPSVSGGLEFYYGESKGKILRAIEHVINQNEPFDLELEIITAKGNIRWVRCIGNGEFINGRCHRIFGSYQDIHLSKSLELRIREILESISDAFYALDDHWNFTYFNKEAENLLNRKSEQIIGENIWVQFSPSVGTEMDVRYKRVLELGITETFEYWYPGDGKWYEINAYPSKSGISVFFKNIDDRKQQELQLKIANERFEKITQATNEAIWDWDITNDKFYWSENIHQLLGESADREINVESFWSNVIHPDDKFNVQKNITRAMDDPTQDRWEMEYRICKNSGAVLNVKDRGLIIRGEDGKAIRIIGSLADITKIKLQEQELVNLNKSLNSYTKELERSNLELEQFAFITSHDLQEPLRMITSFMDQLKRKYGNQLDEKANQYIYYAADGAKRMKKIILDLLDYSRAGKLAEEFEEVNVKDILRDYLHLQRKLIQEKSATIRTKNHLPVVFTQKTAIIMILHSLLDNALKYSRENIPPDIELIVKETDQEWMFSVLDNGIGIEEEFHSKIFIIFQRLHNKNEFGGTGIGLSLAKKYIEFLGGKIWVESIPDKGSLFQFTIPKKTIQSHDKA